MHSVTVRSWLETGQAVRKYNKSAMFVQQGALSGLKAWSVDNFSLSAVTSDMVGHFVMDRSYLIQCTYCADGMVDRHVIYFWQGWNCSRVESLVWQYDISALMANQVWRLAASVDLSRAWDGGCDRPGCRLGGTGSLSGSRGQRLALQGPNSCLL